LVVCLAILILTGCRSQSKVNWFPEPGVVNWEAEKQQKAIPTDMIVVHHTAAPPGMTWQELSRIGDDKFFAPCFDPKTGTATPPDVRGMRVQSNHFRQVEQSGGLQPSVHFLANYEVFYVYHWLVRQDGKTERLLKDGEVGWHSGDMATNYRSVGIVFDGDYTNEPPPDAALQACARLIANYEKKQQIVVVIGHREVTHNGNPVKTECPGNWWLAGGKEKLLALVERMKK
jgi:hypothetical protein